MEEMKYTTPEKKFLLEGIIQIRCYSKKSTGNWKKAKESIQNEARIDKKND